MSRTRARRGYAVLLAYHFPPMVGAASQRAEAFARHLPETGWEPIVITTRSGVFHRDPRVDTPNVTVHRTASPELTRAVHALSGRRGPDTGAGSEIVRPIEGGRVVSAARRLVREWVYVPDAQAGWIPFAVAAIRKTLADLPGPVVLFSTSVPISAHLAAARIVRRREIPWVAEFRDPWSSARGTWKRTRARARLDSALESRIVNGAHAVVVTADRTAEDFRAIHPGLGSEDVHVVRNAFEPGEIGASPPDRKERLSLVFLGNVPLHVSPEPLLRAVQRVAERKPGELRLQVLGPPAAWEEFAGRLGHPEWLTLDGLVPPSEARAAIASASANVLYLPGEEYTIVVAAKLYEYLGARRPILAVLPPDSEMDGLARRFGDMRVTNPDDTEGLEAEITRLLDEQRAGLLEQPVTSAEPLDELSWQTQVGRLAELFDALASSGTRRRVAG